MRSLLIQRIRLDDVVKFTFTREGDVRLKVSADLTEDQVDVYVKIATKVLAQQGTFDRTYRGRLDADSKTLCLYNDSRKSCLSFRVVD